MLLFVCVCVCTRKRVRACTPRLGVEIYTSAGPGGEASEYVHL